MPPATGTVNSYTLQELETYSYPNISINRVFLKVGSANNGHIITANIAGYNIVMYLHFSLFNPLKIYIFLIFEKVLVQRLKVLHRIFKMA